MLKWAEDGKLTAFGNRLVFTASHLINMKLFDGFVMDRGVALCKAIDAGGHEIVDLKYDTIRFTKISSRLFQLLCGAWNVDTCEKVNLCVVIKVLSRRRA